MPAPIDLDAERWALLVEEALACAERPGLARNTLQHRADACLRAQVGEPADLRLFSTFRLCCLTYAGSALERRARLRGALKILAEVCRAVLAPPAPAAAAAIAAGSPRLPYRADIDG